MSIDWLSSFHHRRAFHVCVHCCSTERTSRKKEKNTENATNRILFRRAWTKNALKKWEKFVNCYALKVHITFSLHVVSSFCFFSIMKKTIILCAFTNFSTSQSMHDYCGGNTCSYSKSKSCAHKKSDDIFVVGRFWLIFSSLLGKMILERMTFFPLLFSFSHFLDVFSPLFIRLCIFPFIRLLKISLSWRDHFGKHIIFDIHV